MIFSFGKVGRHGVDRLGVGIARLGAVAAGHAGPHPRHADVDHDGRAEARHLLPERIAARIVDAQMLHDRDARGGRAS